MALLQTELGLRTFPLSHARPYESAAFLLRSHDDYLLYLGDTGADELELSHQWQAVGPLVRAGQLKALLIETSYANEQPEQLLFGHLTPARLMQELAVLGQIVGPGPLRAVPIVITHRKPPASNEAAIARQLSAANALGLRLIYPLQGQRLQF